MVEAVTLLPRCTFMPGIGATLPFTKDFIPRLKPVSAVDLSADEALSPLYHVRVYFGLLLSQTKSRIECI
jgi:hypothetical protein